MITIFVMVFIFVQSALPGKVSGAESNFIVRWIVAVLNADAETVSFVVRKMAHFTEYMILGGCLMLDVRDFAEKKTGVNLLFIAWIIGALYAATDEFHQRFVPQRSGEFRDVCIDAAGVAAGVLIMWGITKWRQKRKLQRK
jgi:VanZ family protein